MEQFDEKYFFELYNTHAEKAFKFLIKSFQERLYYHIRKIVLTHENADDVLQNTFVKIWYGLPNFNKQSSLYTWVYRIATNEALSYLRKHKKHFSNNIENGEQNDVVNTLRSDDFFEGNEIELKLQEALSLLPEKQKLVFNMKYFEHMKYDEISEILGTSIGALKASYHIAVKKIKEFLKNN